MSRIPTRISILAAVLTMPSAISFAADVEYEIWTGAALNDNVARTETDEIEETIALAGLQLDFLHESRRVYLTLESDLEYRNYIDDTFDDETVGALDGLLSFDLAEDVFSWTFENRFGNLQTNPFEPNTAGNRENYNIFSTGPDFRMRFGDSIALEASARYRRNTFEESDIDSTTRSARMSLIRGITRNRSLSLNATFDQNEFDDTVFNDNFDRTSAFLMLDSRISRGDLAISVGINKVKPKFGESTDGPLYRVVWTRDLTASTGFTLEYFQGLTYAGATGVVALETEDGVAEEQADDFADVVPNAAVSDAFENQSMSIGLDFRNRGNRFFAIAEYNEDEYLNTSVLDSKRTEFRIGIERVLGSAWLIRLSGFYQNTEYLETGREDDDLTGQIGLSRQLSRAVRLNADYFYTDRESTADGFSYVENVYYLTISYSR